ncbi:MAG TPA: M48 family metallopeptidase [Chitinophagaceae bacterium]|nr:M48 family metallopeptidase [Chitinophagaceae bacterium]
MKSYLGTYSSFGTPAAEATVAIFDKEIHIGYNDNGQPAVIKWDIREVTATYEQGPQQTRLRHPRDNRFDITIDGNEAANYIQLMQAELARPWTQTIQAREWGRNLLLFLGIIGGLVLLYFLLVPWLAGLMAGKVSVKTEERFGEAVYDALRIEDSQDTAASYLVNQFFNEMDVPTAYNIRITVAKGNVVNAFALPGGRIVVYDELIRKMESYPELAALLSHEFTHVNNKHSTKSIFRRLGSRVFIGLLFGKLGTVTTVLVDHADNLKSLKYSRRLEKEADSEGLELLKERKIDPKGFNDLFRHLKESAPASAMPEFLASHPDIDKRIEYITEKSAGAVVQENERLKSIFEKLKQTIP